MHDYIIAPSILSADFAHLGEEVDRVLAAGADWIHFDVMDNHFVPNLSIGPMVCAALRKHGVQAPIDVHLMVRPVDRLIGEFIDAGASSISFHPEASEHVDRSLALIKNAGLKAGLVLNPATPVDLLEWCHDKLDLVLLMSVNPGFGGQEFIPSTLRKLSRVRHCLDQWQSPARLQVDGGIKVENIADVAASGADCFVAGSAIFNSGDYPATIGAMRTQLATVQR